jgi:hypothetical protein
MTSKAAVTFDSARRPRARRPWTARFDLPPTGTRPANNLLPAFQFPARAAATRG